MHIDLDSILRILSYVVPIVGALLLQSPIGKRLPHAVVDVLAKLQPGAIDEMYDHLKTSEARRETAIEYVQAVALRYNVPVSPETAGQLVDYLTKVYKQVRK